MKIIIFIIALIVWSPFMAVSFLFQLIWFGLKSGWYIADSFIHWFMDDKIDSWQSRLGDQIIDDVEEYENAERERRLHADPDCPECNGWGRIRIFQQNEEKCPVCSGAGIEPLKKREPRLAEHLLDNE